MCAIFCNPSEREWEEREGERKMEQRKSSLKNGEGRIVPPYYVIVGGEVFAWGTNSMGQCGQGHANSSVTTPSKVKGLESIQVRQISAGTSHSIMWTAIPTDRYACVDNIMDVCSFC